MAGDLERNTAAGTDKDEQLEELFARYVDRLNRGEQIHPQQILAKHPELGDELLHCLEGFIDAEPAEPLGTLGDYTLRRQIGRGGMGVVYEAWQESMNRQVALKVLPVGVAADKRAFTRFMREAQTSGQLSHPNIVGVHSFGSEQQTPYYAMEYVEGETLGQVLGKIREAEPESETTFGQKDSVVYFGKLAAAFADVADGLQHAHSKGVIHRDIKPSNLILDSEGRLRILDFGLAHLEGQESLTLSGVVVGTPSYMSPEQARAKKDPIDHRTDVYSLGATMYEALTLKPPFKGTSHHDTLSQILERDPEEPRKINSHVPPDLETIVLQCLRKDRTERYGTAEAVAQDLRRFVRGDPIEARPQSGLEKLGKRLWLYKGIVTATLLILALIIAGLAAANTMIARARDEARYDLYVSNMRLAMEDWHSGNIPRFEELLDRHAPGSGDPDLAGWEWYFLESLRHRELASFEHDDSVHSVSWNRKGNLVAALGLDGIVKVWDVEGSALAAQFELGTLGVGEVDWSPAGDRLAAVTPEGIVVVWNAATDQELFRTEDKTRKARKAAIAWSPDGRRLASGAGEGIVRIHRQDGTPVKSLTATRGNVSALAWSSDGARLAAAMVWPPLLVVWRTDTWKELHRFANSDRLLNGVSWSPSGAELLTASSDLQVKIWDCDSWELRQSLHCETEVYTARWSPDGQLIASGESSGLVRVWSAETGAEMGTLRGHRVDVRDLDWNSKGNLIASGARDGTVKIWDPSEERSIRTIEGNYPAVWSPGGEWMAFENDQHDGIDVLDATSARRVAGVPSPTCRGTDALRDLAFSPDGQLLAVAGGSREIPIWNWTDSVETRRLTGHDDSVSCVAWRPDGASIASGSTDRTVRIWDSSTGEMMRILPGHRGGVCALAWSPEGEHLASASGDREQAIIVWDASSGQIRYRFKRSRSLHEYDMSRHNVLAWSPDGKRLLYGDSQGEIAIWSSVTDEEIFRKPAHADRVKCVAFSPDGTRLATGSADKTVKVWDANSGKQLLTLPGHRFGVYSLCWHPDGQRLLSADDTASGIRIWDATPAYEEEGPEPR